MLPRIAYSRSGQFCHDGSCAWQRRMAPSGPVSRAIITGPRQPSVSPTPRRSDSAGGTAIWIGPAAIPARSARQSRRRTRISHRTALALALQHRPRSARSVSGRASRRAATDGRLADRAECPRRRARRDRPRQASAQDRAPVSQLLESDLASLHVRHRWNAAWRPNPRRPYTVQTRDETRLGADRLTPRRGLHNRRR